MHKYIRPANEEFNGITYLILFSILWYVSIVRNILANGFDSSLILFIIFGLIPVVAAIDIIRRALYYRKKRQEAINYNDKCKGVITKITKDYEAYHNSDQHIRYHKYYYLHVNMYLSNGTVYSIKSEAYRKPIYKYLASNQVSVYTDSSGWHYYLEDFVYKQDKHEPDAFSFPEEYHSLSQYFFKFVIVVFFIFFIYNLFF
ncbi:MAG: hypothetical protein LUH02_01905 [Erysipelotrichaceae bacterium]|nr:hypothetical protein [Erysipelotrichaceae bacterium]